MNKTGLFLSLLAVAAFAAPQLATADTATKTCKIKRYKVCKTSYRVKKIVKKVCTGKSAFATKGTARGKKVCKTVAQVRKYKVCRKVSGKMVCKTKSKIHRRKVCKRVAGIPGGKRCKAIVRTVRKPYKVCKTYVKRICR